jgi:hypothetical protein
MYLHRVTHDNAPDARIDASWDSAAPLTQVLGGITLRLMPALPDTLKA